MFAALSLSAWIAVETGEQADERVESVVPAAPIETHEEAAEAFLTLSVIVLGVAAVGLRTGRIGQAARALGTVGAIALLGAGWRVGHSGGELVYRYGAASAYTGGPTSTTAETAGGAEARRRDRARGGRTLAERAPSKPAQSRDEAEDRR
jgi:hypothetical protein